jgi:hypothetical protein
VHPAVERACVAGLAALPAVRSAEIQVVTTLLKEVLMLRWMLPLNLTLTG